MEKLMKALEMLKEEQNKGNYLNSRDAVAYLAGCMSVDNPELHDLIWDTLVFPGTKK